jgi:hypothetical protein
VRPVAGHHLVRGPRLGERQHGAYGRSDLLLVQPVRDRRQLRAVDFDDEVIRTHAMFCGEPLVRAGRATTDTTAPPGFVIAKS